MAEVKFLIVAGEPSGDRHGADLVSALKDLNPEITFYGIGGEEMAREGVTLLYHLEQLAFLGFAEIIKHLPFVFKVLGNLKRWIDRNQPAAVILIDYPGFNLRLARIASRMDVPVVYYICPQLWAWGRRRVEKIRRFVDLPLVIFKFEEDFYRHYHIPSKFVGHPLVDEIKIILSATDFRKKHNLHPENPIVALLPGSRVNEVNKLLPLMVETAMEFKKKYPVEFVIGKSASVPLATYQEIIKDRNGIQIVEKDTHHLMKHAFAAVVASGTATLETGYLGTPMIVLYMVSPLTYRIGKLLVRIKNIALANIVSGEQVVPELIQKNVTVENIYRELEKYFQDPAYYKKVTNALKIIPEKLGNPGAAKRAAREIVDSLELSFSRPEV
jgi:lipid-A-disaccharide synthase